MEANVGLYSNKKEGQTGSGQWSVPRQQVCFSIK
jgi:hypothetical protein